MGGRAFAPLRKNRRVWETVERVAGLFGLAGKLEQPTRSLSQGDKKLLDVASAFALSPEIILLDEPTSGVSTAEKTTIMQVLARAAKETGIKAIIQVEHDMDIVFGYSSRIIAVHNGKILADGSPAMIRAREDVMAIVVGRP
jgi:branched-chain amino acid transport system ATP-binding protein